MYMKLVAIIAFGLAAFVLIVWILVTSLRSSQHESALNMHPAMFEKPDIELTEGLAEQKPKSDLLVDYSDRNDPDSAS